MLLDNTRAEDVFGVLVSQGNVVSPPESGFGNAALLLTVTNAPTFLSTTAATDLTGVYTAVAGSVFVLQSGVSIGGDDGSNSQSNPTNIAPRTAVGVDVNEDYLYLITIDGRQGGVSDGASMFDTGEWLRIFGADTGLNLDGGGSTAMAIDNGSGGATVLNTPISGGLPGMERLNGSNFGARARAVPEPATVSLLLLGVSMVLLRRR